MPKEKFYQSHDDAGDPTATYFQVGWTRDRDCQIAIIDPPSAARTNASFRHVDLDRSTINRLIRSLRKARDQAFGADA